MQPYSQASVAAFRAVSNMGKSQPGSPPTPPKRAATPPKRAAMGCLCVACHIKPMRGALYCPGHLKYGNACAKHLQQFKAATWQPWQSAIRIRMGDPDQAQAMFWLLAGIAEEAEMIKKKLHRVKVTTWG